MERRQVTIWGMVQGVGFRPFLYQLATHYQLAGFVANRQGRVSLELEGPGELIDQLLDELWHHLPPGAAIDGIETQLIPSTGDRGFSIQQSKGPQLDSPALPDRRPGTLAWLAPDRALCTTCRDELTDPTSRRSGYALISCTVCGPRLTLARRQPYERDQTSLAEFPLCERCQADYDDPQNRRFHAEASSCPHCGPTLELRIHARFTAPPPTLGNDRGMLRWMSEQLLGGAVVALKGIGGYHLACDAHNTAAVRRLRSIQRREARPLAAMVRDLASAERWCELTTAERQWLTSPASPIVLVRHRTALPEVLDASNPLLGIMLPYSPLHHMLMQELGDRLLVMTSANESGAPILIDDEQACERLLPHVDAIVLHRRRIEVRCDDSVLRLLPDGPLFIRRSRGFVPQPLALKFPCQEPILAVGGQAKSVFAFGLGSHALLSQHLGDLDDWSTAAAFPTEIAHWEQLFQMRPHVLAHDLHPDYASTRYAERRAESEDLRLIAVQHHHAHFASCLTEH
ncbi:MAG: carbamoyltransferase HypF, partial [Planctomycetota bacterium]